MIAREGDTSLAQDWYDTHAEHFAQRTMGNDMREIYDRFLAHLPSGAHILDAGCGPGRDAKAFIDRGYRVSAIDASAAMVRMCTEHAGIPARQMRFQDVTYHNEFDGIWACASLLHAAREELPGILRQLSRALKPGGIFYMSFQLGEGDRVEPDGRRFTNFTPDALKSVLARSGQLKIIEMWDVKLGDGERRKRWLHALARRDDNRTIP
jgi:SAM-dependent methyltransferase